MGAVARYAPEFSEEISRPVIIDPEAPRGTWTTSQIFRTWSQTSGEKEKKQTWNSEIRVENICEAKPQTTLITKLRAAERAGLLHEKPRLTVCMQNYDRGNMDG